MYTLTEAGRLPAAQVGQETVLLVAHAELVPAALVLPPGFEEDFYRHNNLPAQLTALFSGIRPQRIDEDALEPLCLRASGLISGHALLDDRVQQLYRALHAAGLDHGGLHLRRPGERTAYPAQVQPPGTAALHALKRLWAADWHFAAVLSRLDSAGGVGLEARPVLLLRGDAGHPDAGLARQLGVRAVWTNAAGLVGLEP